jgi:membrane-associated protease RseP (regulator of RpoE activity)
MLLKRVALHVILFSLTFVTTVFAGVQWLNLNPYELADVERGIPYGVAVCFILMTHELGHYFAARVHRVDVTLPYFLPFPSFLLGGVFPFGTLGAVIRLRSSITSRKVLFDIGASGPIAGFVASIFCLVYGFSTLPTIDYLYSIHPEYVGMPSIPKGGLTFGAPLLYSMLGEIVTGGDDFVPPMNEIYHYPFLCAGWFGLLVTAMNLIPVGQLDGGHVAGALLPKHAKMLGKIALAILCLFGLLGFLPLFGIDFEFGWSGWLVWAIALFIFLRRTGGRGSSTLEMPELDVSRRMVAVVCLFIMILSFSISPFTLSL